ncbi:MAG: methyltransferase domain-containing protein [Gemmatimonadota bacterium]
MTYGTREEAEQTARYYDAIAARYDADVDGVARNVTAREAFCRRVSAIAGPRGTLLDFGCGTGIDAAWYAARGHQVIAYDISRGMVNLLRTRCAAEIAAGVIAPVDGDLDNLIAMLERTGPVTAVAANFAVLNHFRDLNPLLRLLERYMVRDGAVIASVLNPFYRRDMKKLWWWRGAATSVWTGSIKVDGAVTTYRHFSRSLRRMAQPCFTLAVDEVRDGGASNFVTLVLRKSR